jgi:hypothetical protein
MAKKGNTIPKSDQPRYGMGVTKKDSGSLPGLQYRVQGMKSYDRSSSTRNLGRENRG